MALDCNGSRRSIRPLQELRIHPALEDAGFSAFLPEFQEVVRCQPLELPERPVLVTETGLVLAGFGRWRMAVSRRDAEIECFEYPLTEDDALQFMLSSQKTQSYWNAFIRIRLALSLEAVLQKKALSNMQTGGKCKGSARLPDAQQIDVRERIAAIAGVGSRNVSKVKDILAAGHPRILGELATGLISINRAHLLCQLPVTKQLEALTESYCERVIDDVADDLIRQGERDSALSASALLEILRQRELERPGSVRVQLSKRKHTIIFAGEDLQTVLCDESQARRP